MIKYIIQAAICTVADIEELLKEVAAMDKGMPIKTRCQALQEQMIGTNAVYAVSCDAEGRYECAELTTNTVTKVWKDHKAMKFGFCAGSCPHSVTHANLRSFRSAGVWMKQATSFQTQQHSRGVPRYAVSSNKAATLNKLLSLSH